MPFLESVWDIPGSYEFLVKGNYKYDDNDSNRKILVAFIFGVGTAFSRIDEHVKEMINKVAEVSYKINKLNFSDIAATLSLAS
jgi:hypothetical protein